MKKLIIFAILAAMMLSMVACGAPSKPENPTTDAPTQAPTQEPTAEPTTVPTTIVTEPPKSEAAVAVDDMILAIGEVVVGGKKDSGDTITAAEEAYNALSDEEKAEVENLQILTDARATYDKLAVEAANKAAAKKIIKKINKLDNSSDAEDVIKVIRQYNELSKEVQGYVDNYEDLQELAHSMGKKRLKTMAEEEDFVRGYNFYYPDAFAWGGEYWYADQGCFALPYIGTSKNDTWMRLVFNFNRYDWIFFEEVTVAADDDRFYESFSYWDVVRDNGGGEVWEYVDINVGNYEIEMLWAIAKSDKTVVRFEGDDYYYDYTVTSSQKKSIKYALITYELLCA